MFRNFEEAYDELLEHQQSLREKVDAKTIIKELIDTSFGGDNKSQMKAVQLLKGLATSDDPASNAFMKKLDKWTSGLGGKMNEKMDVIGMALDIVNDIADNLEDSAEEEEDDDLAKDAKTLQKAGKSEKAFRAAIKNKKTKGLVMDAIEQGIDIQNLSSEEEDALLGLFQ